MDTTQAAAQKCADLANAAGSLSSKPDHFLIEPLDPSDLAFRRYVEHIHTTNAKVFDLLDEMADLYKCEGAAMSEIKALLRDNLLPDPQPSDEAMAIARMVHGLTASDGLVMAGKAIDDWIAKRGVEVKP
jgi:hypothetical protein